jgi:hypothetical protein
LDAISNLEHYLDGEVSILPNGNRWQAGEPYYPVIAVPVENKGQFICPAEHQEVAASVLEDCIALLVVGASGKDLDVLSLLREHLNRCEVFHLVAGPSDAEEVKTRYFAGVPQLQQTVFSVHDGGFTEYLRGGNLEYFLSHASSLD